MVSFGKIIWFNHRFSGSLSSVARTFFSAERVPATYVDSNRTELVRYKFLDDPDKSKSLADAKRRQFESSFVVVPDAVSADEESRLVNEIEKSLKRLRYQHDHWDDAIHGYRETEISAWNDVSNARVLERLRAKVFANDSTTEPMQSVHILDLCADGYVKPHIDSVRFCGNIIAGLSMLSDSVMCLADKLDPNKSMVYAVLPRRSLYIMKDDVRYQYTHEILNNGAPSVFSDKDIVRQRRISIVLRNEPPVNLMK